MDESPLGQGRGEAERGAARLQTTLWTVCALAVFCGTLGLLGFAVALWVADDLEELRAERDALRARLDRLEAVRRATGASQPESALSQRGDDLVRAEAEARLRRSLDGLSEQVEDLGADLEALAEETDLLVGRELRTTVQEGLSSYGQDQALFLGAHGACFLIHTQLGTSQNAACDLRQDGFTRAWTLTARSAECRAGCLDWE